ncbi:MAG: serine/threonine-protein kinase [Polyangiaceae bacterium]
MTHWTFDAGDLIAETYRVVRTLGRGGNGEVYHAESAAGEHVAVKVIAGTSESSAASVWHQARAMGQVQSAHVPRVYAPMVDSRAGTVFVTELVRGESLIHRLKRDGPMRFRELKPIVSQVWTALHAVHSANILHCNIKPSNVVLGADNHVTLIDFCSARMAGPDGLIIAPDRSTSLGWFSFIPPELIGRSTSMGTAGDIYICGTLIFQALSGQLPFAAKNILQMVDLKAKGEPRRLSSIVSGVPPELDHFLGRTLARDPAARFQSAFEARTAWEELDL